jgi:dehydrogenase/reductase SDR family member 12
VRRQGVITPQTLVDTLLEILVVPSFARSGYAIRRRLFDWDEPEWWRLDGRTVVITGPTSGLGREAAGSLAAMGARLVLVGRDASKLARTREDIARETGNANLATVVADMSSLASVRAAADQILAAEPRIDVLIDNAGAIFDERAETPEGFEKTFATMVLGSFVLLSRLAPRLAESPDPRVASVTSGGMYTQALPLDDLGYERGEYSGPRAYARAKRAQVALMREWARRRPAMTIAAMHPGWADTPGLAASLPGFRDRVGSQLRTPAEGVDTLLWLAAAPREEITSGRLYLDRRPRPFDRLPSTRLSRADRLALWNAVVKLTGEDR